MRRTRVVFPDPFAPITAMRSAGNTVISEVMWTGTQKGELATPTGVVPPSNREVRLSAVMISRVQDGKIVSTREWFDFFQMLQQIDALPALKTRKAGA